ncbi:PREDICTED: transmembrane protein 81 [Gavialis gangeticus]|uniref:transmembrane protein 81 n=1 Tax=Gavialis gangeticus TaxID=94835 RepID=UPI00092ED7A2|nr:PREDICTED: transmembrane protein 81 [Gavialis gangeticus]
MKTSKSSFILGTFTFAFCLPTAVSLETVTIPEKLKSATVKVSVSTTSCSVTCGLGFKVEEVCELGPDGKRRHCTFRRSDCLTSWICGLLHFTVPVGKPFELSCLTSEMIGIGSQAFIYTWRLARGIITTNDVLFKSIKTPSYVIKLSPAKESDAGTYRCDVQLMKTFKLVKRIYFGLRVIPTDLIELKFYKSLTLEQKLAEYKKEGNGGNGTIFLSRWQQDSWQRRALVVFVVGIGSGVAAAILVGAVLFFLLKARRKNEAIEG